MLGLTLLEIKSALNDTRNVLSNWQELDESPCAWTGITCHPGEQRVRSMYANITCPSFYYFSQTVSAEFDTCICSSVPQKSAVHATGGNHISQHW